MQADMQRVHARLSHLVEQGADAARVAAAAVEAWHGIHWVLAPVIGLRGVAALHRRSLFLAGANHPCLRAASDNTVEPDLLAALQTALQQQSGPDAMAANGALLQTFCSLLTTLIGASLTERLLRMAWDPTTSGTAAQDYAP